MEYTPEFPSFLALIFICRCYIFVQMAQDKTLEITPQFLILIGIVALAHFYPHVTNAAGWVVFWASVFGVLHVTLFLGELIAFFVKRKSSTHSHT